jgi:hypothetical protein
MKLWTRFEWRNVQGGPPAMNGIYGPPKPSCQFVIVHCAQQPDFPHSPAPRNRQAYATRFALCNNLLNRAACPARQH